MKATIITSDETNPYLIESLPTRPTAPSAFGGKGYTAHEMKKAFDKLPTLIIMHFNDLIRDIEDGGICDAIPTDISGAPTLASVLGAFTDGTLASVIAYRDTTLAAYLEALRADVDRLLAAKESEANG